MNEKKQKAFSYLIELSKKKGYVTFNDIINLADKWNLPIQDVDLLSNSITMRGILVYDGVPTSFNKNDDSDEYEDYAQTDYESVFDKVLKLDESLLPLIEGIKNIRPPQFREICQLKYQVKEGNLHARQRMIEMHLRMAVRIALQRAETYDTDISDAISCAFIGLITAVDRYDPDSNGAFGSYASLWMYQVISREQPTQRPLAYYSMHKKEDYYTVYMDIKKRGCMKCPSIENCDKLMNMVCSKLNCSQDQAEDVVNACIPFESIESLEDAYEFDSDIDQVEPIIKDNFLADDSLTREIERIYLKEQLAHQLNSLRDREREVLIERYGLNNGTEKTLEEVGKIFAVTRERIRQIEAKAIRKLRRPANLKILKDFWE